MPVKTDRNDARSIAMAMRVGWYSEVHIKSKESQVLRMLLTNRKTLLDKQIDIDNAIRGTLRVFGIKVSGRISHATFEGRVREAVAETPNLTAFVEPLLRARFAMREQYAILHRQLLRTVRADAGNGHQSPTDLIRAHGAVTFRTTINDPRGFGGLATLALTLG